MKGAFDSDNTSSESLGSARVRTRGVEDGSGFRNRVTDILGNLERLRARANPRPRRGRGRTDRILLLLLWSVRARVL